MEIYFDKKKLKVLSAIYRKKNKGITWGKLQKKYEEDATPEFLIYLSREMYICTVDAKGNIIPFEKGVQPTIKGDFKAYTTSKGNSFIEERRYNFLRWIIPTIISVISLLVSFFSLALSTLL